MKSLIRHKTKIIAAVLIAAALTAAYFWGGRYPKNEAGDISPASAPVESPKAEAPFRSAAPSAVRPTAAPSVEPAAFAAGKEGYGAEPSSAPEKADEADGIDSGADKTREGTSAKAEERAVQAAAPPDEAAAVETVETSATAAEAAEKTPAPGPEGSSEGVYTGSAEYSEAQGMTFDPKTGKDRYMTDPVPEGKPVPVEPQDAVITDVEWKCTLSVRCDTILDNMDLLDKEKW